MEHWFHVTDEDPGDAEAVLERFRVLFFHVYEQSILLCVTTATVVVLCCSRIGSSGRKAEPLGQPEQME